MPRPTVYPPRVPALTTAFVTSGHLLRFLVVVPLLLVSCQQFKAAFTRTPLPDLGPRLTTPVTVSFDQTLLEAKAPYVDACGSPWELPIGKELEATIVDGLYQNFNVVDTQSHAKSTDPAEMDVHVSLTRQGWKILTDNVYDRLPAELTLEAQAVFRDVQGTVKASRTLSTTQRGRLIVEPTQRRCMYVNADTLLHDAAIDLTTQLLREARAQAQGQTAGQAASTPQPASTGTATTPLVAPQITPPAAAPATVAPVPAAPRQAADPRAALTTVDDVDRFPPSSTWQAHPHTYVLAIGLSSYRDQEMKGRKYASLDAETVASSFKTVGGVPASNVRLLQDWKALRTDIDEALLDWLPTKTDAESIVIVYVAGDAVAGPGGEMYLVPFDGSPASLSHAYPLKDLQSALARLRAFQTLMIFDGNIAKTNADTKVKPVAPLWDLGAGNHLRLISTTGLGKSVESDKLRHGLFTYYFLRGLRGEADEDQDGRVTIGEIVSYVRDRVPPASKGELPQLQLPMVTPSLSKVGKSSSIPLAQLTAPNTRIP